MDLSDILICNGGCGNHLIAGEYMVCNKCQEKYPPAKIEYVIREPRTLDHVIPGTCDCECHDIPGFYHCFGIPCCQEENVARAGLHNPKKKLNLPIPVLGDFTKFVYPLIRPKKNKRSK